VINITGNIHEWKWLYGMEMSMDNDDGGGGGTDAADDGDGGGSGGNNDDGDGDKGGGGGDGDDGGGVTTVFLFVKDIKVISRPHKLNFYIILLNELK
jgi:hypothetical protein